MMPLLIAVLETRIFVKKELGFFSLTSEELYGRPSACLQSELKRSY